MPTFQHGKSTYVAIGTAGSETDISSSVTKAGMPSQVAKADTTTFGSTDESSLPGIKSHTVSLTGKWSQTVHNTLTALLAVAAKSIVIGPQGSTVGNVKRSAAGYLAKYQWDGDVGSAEDWTAEFIVVGSITDGTF